MMTSHSPSPSTSARAWPTTPAPGAPSGRCTSTACRRATTPARPGRTCRLAVPRRGRRLRGRLAADHGRQPVPRDHGPGLLPPVRDGLQPRPARQAVGINSVERFLGDEAIQQGWTVCRRRRAPTGRRVLVVGAGPSGLSAAYHCAGSATRSTIRDAGAAPGGMMRYGIPTYRLPRDVLDAEIAAHPRPGRHARARHAGRPTSRGRAAGRRVRRRLLGGRRADRQARLHPGRRVRRGSSTRVSLLRELRGRRAAACSAAGSSSTAAATPRMDAARTARRLGADEAVVVYRRTRDRMPAHDIEVEEALEEGVTMQWLSTIAHAGDGTLRDREDAARRDRLPAADRGVRGAAADCVVLALGQDVDLVAAGRRARRRRSPTAWSRSDPDLMTGHPGVFAGGDMVPAERTVTVAIGHGKTAARSIDAWLRGARHARRAAKPDAGVGFDAAQHLVLRDAPRTVRPQLDAARRTSDFDEVVGGLDESTALFEARRCLSCGNCFGCDNCFGVCPDNAVIKLGRRASATRSTTTTARAAACAPPSAPAARSRWCPSRPAPDHGPTA